MKKKKIQNISLIWKNNILIKKTIKHLTLANNNVVSTDNEILEEARRKYSYPQ